MCWINHVLFFTFLSFSGSDELCGRETSFERKFQNENWQTWNLIIICYTGFTNLFDLWWKSYYILHFNSYHSNRDIVEKSSTMSQFDGKVKNRILSLSLFSPVSLICTLWGFKHHDFWIVYLSPFDPSCTLCKNSVGKIVLSLAQSYTTTFLRRIWTFSVSVYEQSMSSFNQQTPDRTFFSDALFVRPKVQRR